MMIHAPGILGGGIGENGRRSTVFLEERFLDFPRVGLNANGELKILFRNGIPVLRKMSARPTKKRVNIPCKPS